MADEYVIINKSDLTNIADAVRDALGTTDNIAVGNLSNKVVESIKTSSGSSGSELPTIHVSLKDINFYDYNGTLVASYSLSEAQSLTALPDGPTHSGLTFQGWNYTLEKVKAFTRPMNVGAMYITDDGKTRLHIRIAAEGRMNVPLYISQTVANGVTIDWGDGSATETLAGTGDVNTSHTYAEPGDYVISLMPDDGCTLSLGKNASTYCVMGSTSTTYLVYCNMLQDVSIGKNVTSIRNDAFQRCYSLASITIPNGVTSIGNEAFMYCYSLASITIPTGVTYIGHYAFYSCYSLASIAIPTDVTSISPYTFPNCYSLASITIPDSVTSISDSTFKSCHSLASITIPESVTNIRESTFEACHSLASITIPDRVTSIGTKAFYACSGMAEYHLKPTTPPTLSNTNAFDNISSDCVIYVPQGCLEAYQKDTKWAKYASKMQEEPVNT